MSLSPGMQSSEANPDANSFVHFMLQEIHQQPEVVRACFANYLDPQGNRSPEPGANPIRLGLPEEFLENLEQIHILACGTSRHAGLVAQYWLEQIAGIPTRVRSASEFVSAPFPFTARTLTIAITQSGETADTLAAVEQEQARRAGQVAVLQPKLLGITNQPTSSLTQRVHQVLPTLAGAEVGVAATKTFLSQLVVLICLCLDLAYRRQTLATEPIQPLLTKLQALPEQISAVLQQASAIQQLAQEFVAAKSCVVLGRGVNRAIALEAALKLKETTYIHAEGYAAGEFLHGPIALLDPTIPVIAIAPTGKTYEQAIANAQKAKSHGASVIGITTTDAPVAADLFDSVLKLPAIDELLSPFLTVIPLQLLAYYIAVERGLNVDKPRHITKTLA
jgi:glucosamine--fructose-6-phosphate aminotransferase (isomerizing)